MKANYLPLGLIVISLAQGAAAAPAIPLWQIGQADHNDAEFALAPGRYADFQQYFGKPDHAYYIGLSDPRKDWPYVLPGPVDGWAGSHDNRWDQMNTLPIGFVLDQVPTNGECVLTIAFCDTQPQRPPMLRITVNGVIFERQLAAGGSDDSVKGKLDSAKPQVVKVAFPVARLKRGYNEIALRCTHDSWAIFDELHLDCPDGTQLAPPSATIIRSVTAASYAVATNPATPATLRVELFRAGLPGKLEVKVGTSEARHITIQPGLQVLEIPAPASTASGTTRIQLSADGQLLCDTELSLRAVPLATPADYVDVFLGTAHSRWMIAPGPWMPFSMVKISPDNQSQGWCAGYEYSHEYIDCFSHIHEWTMAGLGVMPTLGPLRTQPGLRRAEVNPRTGKGLLGEAGVGARQGEASATQAGLDGTGYSSRFDKSTEHGGIGFYEVLLKDSGIKVELTATTRAALQRYTYPASDQARVMFDFLIPTEYQMHVLGATVRRTGPAEIEGTVRTDCPNVGYNGDQRYDLHFVAQLSRPFDTLGGWQGDQITSNAKELTMSNDCGVFLKFKTSAGEQVLLRTSISLVSVANSRINLDQELAQPFGWDFAAVVRNQRRVWNDVLARVEIQTPDAREKTRFYSNLYRALSGRNTWSDVNGGWIDPFGRPQQLEDPHAVMLGCDALWTTFWNLNQVMNLIAPEWSVRWVKSELQLYDHCGWLAKGPAGLKYISVMVAEHEIPLLVAACQHGLKGVDAEKILAAAVKMQTTPPRNDLPGGGAAGNANLENYLKYGYVAEDGPVGPGGKAEWHAPPRTSNTYEYAYDDWCVAQLALALGHKDVADQFLKRSQSWRKVLDPETGYARPRKTERRLDYPIRSVSRARLR